MYNYRDRNSAISSSSDDEDSIPRVEVNKTKKYIVAYFPTTHYEESEVANLVTNHRNENRKRLEDEIVEKQKKRIKCNYCSYSVGPTRSIRTHYMKHLMLMDYYCAYCGTFLLGNKTDEVHFRRYCPARGNRKNYVQEIMKKEGINSVQRLEEFASVHNSNVIWGKKFWTVSKLKGMPNWQEFTHNDAMPKTLEMLRLDTTI